MNRVSPPMPTPEQIEANAVITWSDDQVDHEGRACWYPQMGGYVAKCVVELGGNDSCFEAWVWHDGDFPFADDDPSDDEPRAPLRMHHCRADQFIHFGEDVKRFAAERLGSPTAATISHDGRTMEIEVRFGPSGPEQRRQQRLSIGAASGRRIIDFLGDQYGEKAFDIATEATTFVGCRLISIEDGKLATIEYFRTSDPARKATS